AVSVAAQLGPVRSFRSLLKAKGPNTPDLYNGNRDQQRRKEATDGPQIPVSRQLVPEHPAPNVQGNSQLAADVGPSTMPATPLFHPENKRGGGSGRLDCLTKKEAASLATLKQLARKQGLSLGLVRGPGEQNDVCLLRFLRAQRFEEKRALASLVSCVEWGASVGLSGLRGHPGGGAVATAAAGQGSAAKSPLPAAEGLVHLGSGFDRLGRPLVFVRLEGLSPSLLEACGKKALLRYFIWSIERVLERIAASMLSTQYIIEGTTVVCDAKGWDQQNVSDGVLTLLQDAAAIGLARYPERLGQLFVVNVSGGAAQARGISLAARALGLGVAVDAGRLRILSGELPKWAPELRKTISPENLPVEYGGTAPA
ncbi:unnamed protein product, partial [Scytosiphon promiscuus]